LALCALAALLGVGSSDSNFAAQGGAVTASRRAMSNHSRAVTKATQAIYDAVVALTDAFGRDHLNDEYHDLAQAMTAAP
jgi:hypothetical protein